MESHPCALAAEPCVGEPLAVQASSKGIVVGSRERSELRIGVQVLVGAQVAALWLTM
jgi:hypothetical protein